MIPYPTRPVRSGWQVPSEDVPTARSPRVADLATVTPDEVADRDVGRRDLATRTRWALGLAWTLAGRDLRIRYRSSWLDVAWALVVPVVTLAVYGYVLTHGFSATASCSPYVVSAWGGLVLWTFFAGAVGGATTSLLGAADMVGKAYFPREAVPLGSTIAASVELVTGLVLFVPLLYLQGVRPGPVAIAALPALVLLVVWTAAIGNLMALLTVFLRDAAHAVHLALRVGFFATPVVYESGFLPPGLSRFTSWSPVSVAIEDLRTAVLCGQVPPLDRAGWLLAGGIVLFGGSIWVTGRAEGQIADRL